jgi:hypothetical protein
MYFENDRDSKINDLHIKILVNPKKFSSGTNDRNIRKAITTTFGK